MDHAKAPDGFREMTTSEFKARVKDLRRVPSGDGGELYFGKDGKIAVEAYPPRPNMPLAPGLGFCACCRSTVDAVELQDGRGYCKGCAAMPSRQGWAP